MGAARAPVWTLVNGDCWRLTGEPAKCLRLTVAAGRCPATSNQSSECLECQSFYILMCVRRLFRRLCLRTPFEQGRVAPEEVDQPVDDKANLRTIAIIVMHGDPEVG